ncbi:MAG: glycosyltransferase family 4 protein [Candidatus Omnitrophica bacterium]|nr:glycosyltransferase family 4 protein [Candidatus Omnitrophota bacterium]
MKIIFITREGYRLPGARIRCYNFSRELKKCGMDAEVLSFSDTLGAKDGEEESCLSLGEKIKLNHRAFRLLLNDKKAVFYIQRFNYHSFAPYLAHILNKNRFILDLDDWEMRQNPRYYLGIYPSSKAHYLTGIFAKRSIFCIAASRFLERFLLQFNKKVHYIPSGVDTDLFSPPVKDPPEDRIIFSWIGTLHKREYIENIDFAASCFSVLRKKYENIYFDIAGDGIYVNDAKRTVNKYNDAHIVLRGWMSYEAVPAYLAGVHIGLMPVARQTNFNQAKSPTKLFEYMAMARPTVSSNIGETAHIIRDDENGLLAGTKEEFSGKMERLVNDVLLRNRLGNNARKTIEKSYSLDVLGKRLHDILKPFESL